jgi:hypothetical protein
MNKKLILILILYPFMRLDAQNLQLHYDFGRERKCLTSTVEMSKDDKWGSNFFFIDMNYDSPGINGVSLAYWEITRGIKLHEGPFELHFEYNGGFGQVKDTIRNRAYQINDAWLFGCNYTIRNTDLSRVFTIQAMYKNIRHRDEASFQITGVWILKFLKNKITCKGFADFWKDKKADGGFVFLTEPQFWYNFTPNFSLGSEQELSTNFGGHHGFMYNPTLAVKWIF